MKYAARIESSFLPLYKLPLDLTAEPPKCIFLIQNLGSASFEGTVLQKHFTRKLIQQLDKHRVRIQIFKSK